MSGGSGAGKEHEEDGENLAAWLLGIKTLKIQPYQLPSLGKLSSLSLSSCLGNVFSRFRLCVCVYMKFMDACINTDEP